jgi:predicted nuclease with TOPRIM domain
MDKHFANLEQKIERVISQCDQLRVENSRLRQELLSRSDEVNVMSAKMEEARHRLQQLASEVPE